MTGRLFETTRVQGNVVAKAERRLLDWICRRLPPTIVPDHLTALSVAGALLAFAADLASWANRAFLVVAALGIVVNWAGDSLDGSLARHRRIERPIYGYFLDHNVDAACNLLLMAGLGAVPHVSMAAALFALVGYLLLCIYVFIRNHLSGVMQLSFLWAGPTELKLSLVVMTLAIMIAPRAALPLGGGVPLYDALLVLAGAVMTALFVHKVALGVVHLRRRESFER